MTTPTAAAIHEAAHAAVASALGCRPTMIRLGDLPQWRGEWRAVRLADLADHEVAITLAGQAGERLLLGAVTGRPVADSAVALTRLPWAVSPRGVLPTADDQRLARLLVARCGTDEAAGRAWLDRQGDRADRLIRGYQAAILSLAHVLDRDGAVVGYDHIRAALGGR